MTRGELGFDHHRDLSPYIESILEDNDGNMCIAKMAEEMGEDIGVLKKQIEQMDKLTIHRGRVIECPE